jgi:acyl carrier protein
MPVENEDYQLEVLEYAVNQCIDRLLPLSSKDVLSAILNKSNEVVWRIATDIYTKSGHSIDFVFIRDILNSRIEPLRKKIAEEERIKKATEAKKAELEDQRQIKEAKEAKIIAKLEVERLERIAEQQRIKQENLKVVRERYPNISLEVFLKIENLIIEELLLEEERIITIDSVLSKDLGADNLYIMELIQAIEKEFDIEIPDDFIGTNWISCICGDFSRLESITVKEILDIVCEKIQ